MIQLELTVDEGKARVRFDVPDEEGSEIPLTDLAAFALYLDVVRQQVTEITTKAVYQIEDYDLTVE
jgi:hypothetical protein